MTRNGKRNMNGMHVFDGMPDSLIQSAEEGATRVADAVETAGTRVAKSAGKVAKSAPLGIKDAKLGIKDAKLNVKDAALTVREKRLGVMERFARALMKRQMKLLPSSADAMVRAQLVRTSRELAHESSDLSAAVDSLNKILKTNRQVAAKSRTRLLGGLAMGAALMYHLDAENGRQRRAATGQLVTRMIRGQKTGGS
jgi:hypothetical protein